MRGLKTRASTCPHLSSNYKWIKICHRAKRSTGSRITPVRELHSIQPHSWVSALIIRFSSLRSIKLWSFSISSPSGFRVESSRSESGEKKLYDGPSPIINHQAHRDCWEMENIETFWQRPPSRLDPSGDKYLKMNRYNFTDYLCGFEARKLKVLDNCQQLETLFATR